MLNRVASRHRRSRSGFVSETSHFNRRALARAAGAAVEPLERRVMLTIVNAGFEVPSVGSGTSAYQYDPAGATWTFGGTAGVTGNNSAFTAGTANAPEGTQVAFLQGSGSSISQSVSMVAGTYSLGFLAAQRRWTPAFEDFEVLVDGNAVGQFTPGGYTYTGYSTAPFTVATGAHTVEFLGLNTAGGDNAAMIDEVSLIPPASAAFVGADAATQGNWVGRYGTDGWYRADGGASLPAYAALNAAGQQSTVWKYFPSSVRALTGASVGERFAACDFSATSFSYDLSLVDGNAHQVGLYVLDWDGPNRSETVSVSDAATGSVLDVQSVSGFTGGRYLVWNLQGHVTITVACTGGPNAVASGIFFDPARDPAVPTPTGLTATRNVGGVSLTWSADTTGRVTGYDVYRESVNGGAPVLLTPTPLTQAGYSDTAAPPRTVYYYVQAVGASGTSSEPAITRADVAASALFLAQDVSTQGTWVGMYGSDGYAQLGGGDGEALPAYVRYASDGGSYVWKYGANSDPRATQNAPNDTTGRTAATDYEYGTLNLDLTLTDAQAHQVALYMMDWDDGGRQQIVQVSDADTGTVLDTRTVSNFQNGVWLTWNLSGHVTISITCTTPGVPAVASDIMFDPPVTNRPAAPTNLSAIATPGGVQLQWSASTAADVVGYDVYRRSSSAGPFVKLNAVPLPGTAYTDTTATTGAANFYRVVAVTAGGQASPPATVVPTAVSFVRADTGTQGSWVGVYGSDGFENFNEYGVAAPYAQTTLSGGQYYTSTWNTSDVRALQNSPTDAGRAVNVYAAANSFSIDLNLTDGNTHQIALYLLDWGDSGVAETVQVSDAPSGTPLNTQSVSSFTTGTWLVWTLSGHVTITVTRTGGPFCAVSALYFDTPPQTRPAAPASLSATSTPAGVLLQWAANTEPNLAGYNVYRRNVTSGPFTLINSALLTSPAYDDTAAPQGQVSYYRVVAVNTLGQGSTASSVASTPSSISTSFARLVRTDRATEGSWEGVYGSDGFELLDTADQLPGYATVGAPGSIGYGWSWGTTDPRAVQYPPGGTRMATTAYASTGFTIDVNLTDAQTHQVALYLLDWDAQGRAETLQVSDAVTGTVLDTRSVSNFSNGLWLVWSLQGHVDITITRTAGPNAVASAIMFAPAAPAAPSSLTASPISAQEVALSWTAAQGAISGYDVERSTDGVYFTTIAAAVQGTAYTDLSAQPGTAYTYRVMSEAGGVESASGATATATTPAAVAPSAPAGLTATATGPTSIALTWAAVPWATQITVNRLDPNSAWTAVATLDGSATGYTDPTVGSSGIDEGTTYAYQVIASNAYGSSQSATVQCTTPLAAPAGLTATPGPDGNGNPQITLVWSNSTGDFNAGIEIDRSTDGVNFAPLPSANLLPSGTSNYVDAGLTAGTHYWYRVRAVDATVSPQLASAVITADATTPTSNDPVLTAGAVSTSEIDLTWAYAPDAGQTITAFEVDRSTDGANFTPVVTSLDPSARGYQDGSLSDDTHYWYLVKAIDADGQAHASQPDPNTQQFANAWTAPLAPVNVFVLGSPTEMDLSWSYGGVGSPTFQIERMGPGDYAFNQVGTQGAGNTTFQDTSGIVAGGHYEYQVVAVAGDGTTSSAPSAAVGADATLGAPAGLTATVVIASEVVLTWNPVLGATGYEVLRQGPTDPTPVTLATVTDHAYVDGSVQPQTTYTYHVVATDDAQDQAPSGPLTVATPAPTSDAPTGLTAVASTGQITLAWSVPPGPVTGYDVWRSVGVGSTNFVEVALGLQTPTFVDTNLVGGLAYTYYITADNAGTVSQPSQLVEATALLAQPTGLTVTGTSPASVQLAWPAMAGALDYAILREGPGQSSYTTIGYASGASYADAAVLPNQTYSYELVAYDAGGPSPASTPVTASTAVAAPPRPTGLTVTASDAASVTLAWNASAGAILYQILRRGVGDNAFAVVGTSYQPGYVDTNVVAGDTYAYLVVATNNSGDSPATAPVFARPPAVAPSAPTALVATDASDGHVTLTWTASSGTVTAYHVERSIDDGDFVQIAAAVQGTTYADDVPAGANVAYRVSAENAGSFSGFSNIASLTLTAAPVAGLTVSAVTSSSITLAWAAPSGAASYAILRRGPTDTSYGQIGSSVAPNFTDTAVQAGSAYSYEVVAVDAGGDSAPSSPLSVTVPAPAPSAPGNLAATANSPTQVTLTWSPPAGTVTAYHVERSTDGVNFAEIDSAVAATTYADAGLQPGTAYTYRVRAENDGAFSPYSTIATVTTPAATAPAMPANLTAIASVDGIALQWSANAEGDLSGYDVLRAAAAAGPFTQLNAQPIAAPAYDDAAAPGGVASYYQVLAVNTSGLLSAAATASATRPAGTAATPTNLAASQVTAAGLLLTWTGPQGVTYSVLRDGQPIATAIQSAAYLDTSASAGASHSYTVTSTDASGNTSAPCAALAVMTPPASAAAYDAVAPTPPTGLTAAANASQPDGAIDLSWAPATDNVAVTAYEVLRKLAGDPSTSPGVQVGAVPAGSGTTTLHFTDQDLDAATGYVYSVIAFDAADNASPAATVGGSTAADQTAPDAPLNLQATAISSGSVSLSWVQPWDNVGVDHYDVTRNSNVYPYTIDLGTTTAPTFTATGLSPGTPYTFYVTAFDAANNHSGDASVTVTTPPAAPPAVDNAPNQYVPQKWQDYFYNTLTAALRQKIEAVPHGGPVTPAAAGWFDPGYDFTFANAPQLASNVVFHDLNGNGYLDPGESAWIPAATNHTGSFATGDTVVAGPTPPVGDMPNGGNVYYVGPSTNGLFDPSVDTLIPDPLLIHGQTGNYDYYDVSGTGAWRANDPVWLAITPHVYTAGDTVLYDPKHLLQPGIYGKTNGISYYNAGAGGTIVWADQTTFRQNFAAMYAGLDQLVTAYAGPDGVDPWSVGAMQASVGGQPVTITGTISVDTSQGRTSTVHGSGTHFMTQVVPGDSIQLGGAWYPVASVSDDATLAIGPLPGATLGVGAYAGPSINGLAATLMNWTKVPATTDPGTKLGFTYLRGQPDAQSLLFPQQFQQLHDALEALTTFPARYDQGLFTDQTSGDFLDAAAQVLDVYQSLYGAPKPGTPAAWLTQSIQDGDADPGSLYQSGLVTSLQGVAHGILGDVFVRGSTNGWKVDSSGNPVTFLSQLSALIHQPNWSQAVGGQPIGDAPVGQVQSVMTAVADNGLWVSNGTGTYVNQKTDQATASLVENPLDYEEALPSPADWSDPGTWGGPYVDNSSIPTDREGVDHWGPGSMVPSEYNVFGFIESIRLPSAANPLGGSTLTSLAIGPQPYDVNAAGWGWGQQPLIAKYAAADFFGLIEDKYGVKAGEYPVQYPNVQTEYLPVPAGFPGGQYLTYEIHLEVGTNFYTGAPVYYGEDVYVNFAIDPPPSLFGLVPLGSFFNYAPSHSAPQAAAIAQPPTGPLPLTTAMDYFNVMPDNGTVDGIVHAAADLSSFGNDTGAITFTAQNGMAQTLLPVNADVSGALPVNAYLTQGAFGTADDSLGTLLDQDVTTPAASQEGTALAYSLDTHVRLNLLVNDASNHLKRVEVIRPGGNAVVFDFAWNATTGMFSPTGTPDGWNGRDANQTYVLRSLGNGNDQSLAYELLFPDGIVHTFGPGGELDAVSDSSSGLSEWMPMGGYQPGGVDSSTGTPLPPAALWAGQQDTADSPRYNLTLDWSGGEPSKVEYQAKDQGQTIDTAIGYGGAGPNDVNALQKADDGNPIPQFSYAVEEDAIVGDGVQWTRSGSVGAGSVTLRTVLTGGAGEAAGSATSDVYTFNAHGLVDSESLGLDAGSGDPATTTYTYQADIGRYANGEPSWAKVTKVTNPDGSWIGYTYDEDTGWVTQKVTPFQSSTRDPAEGDASASRLESYGYDPKLSGNGQAPDPTMLVQPPRTVTDYVLGTQTGETFYDYRTQGGSSSTILTRQALTGSGATWATAGLFSTTKIVASANDVATTVTSASGNLSEDRSASNGVITDTSTSSWLGNTTSQSQSALDPFGSTSSSSSDALGQAHQGTTNVTDAFGRVTQSTDASGAVTTYSYVDDSGLDSWFGPASVTGPDGGVTKYTYTPLGQVATKLIYAGSSESVLYAYVYDAAGHVARLTVSPADSSGNPTGSALVTTYAYDAQGRLTRQVTNAGGNDATANRTTAYAYSFDGTYNVTSVTNTVQSTQVTKTYLDGLTASVTGSASTPATAAEGVVTQAQAGPDAQGGQLTAGSTWVLSTSDGGKSWTKAFTNVLGQQYLTEQSDPSAPAAAGQPGGYVDAFTSFDANGRPTKQIDVTGTVTRTVYDPFTGQAGATWVDVVGDGNFDPTIDDKTLSSAGYGSSDTKLLSSSGVQDDLTTYASGGLSVTDNAAGLVTKTQTTYGSGGGYTVTTTNPDGTQTKDVYTDGLLSEEDQLGADGSTIATTQYTYDGMRRLKTARDSTGTTSYAYYQDGSPMSSADPGHNASTDNTPDPNANQTQTITRADGTTQTQVTDAQGNLVGQSGAGVLQATYGYDTANTGNLNSLTTYGTVTATTNWNYDPNTGALLDKQYADGTVDSFRYNAAGQLAASFAPGVVGTFGYDAFGQQTSSRFNDAATGLVQSLVQKEDDQGRPLITADTDNGRTFTTSDTYTTLGDLKTETFGSAANAVVGYGYYPVSSTGTPNPNAAPDALQTLTVSTPGGQSATQGYSYEPGGKRLQTITVNGVTITYVYLANSNQLQSMTVGTVTTTFTPDGSDGSRLASMSVTAGGQTVYNAGYAYNELNQRTNDVVTRTVVDNSGSTSSENDNRTYTYDPNQADSLTQVKDANGNVLYGYSYDGVGNRTGTGYGSANSVNEYSNLTYNLRGDLTDDGTEHFTWDAENRLIGEAPDTPSLGSTAEQMGYDGQGRMLWQDVYTYDTSSNSFVFSYTHKFVWDGQDLVSILDANNTLVENFTWGPGVAGADTLVAITDDTLATPKTEEAVEDASGNLVALVNPLTDTVDASYSYGPFGENFTSSGPEASLSPFGFQMMLRDPSGKWYDHARWYDADQGRFISRDPIGTYGGLNEDAFANNDPINKTDRTGYAAEEDLDEMLDELDAERELERKLEEQADVAFRMHTDTPEEQAAETALWKSRIEQQKFDEELKKDTEPVREMFEAANRGNDPKTRTSVEDLLVGMYRGRITPDEAVRQWREMQAAEAAPPPAPSGPTALGPPLPTGYTPPAAVADANGRSAFDPNLPATFSPGTTQSGTGEDTISHPPNGDAVFRGMTVQAQEDLTHLSKARLQDMAEFGTSGITEDGETITLHHVNQNPGGPLWEIPRSLNDVNNRELHPFGNASGAGLTAEERAAFNVWRNDYWRARAREELDRRQLEQNGAP